LYARPLQSPHSKRSIGSGRILQKTGANLLDLINNILDLSKVESGHFELESIDFDLRPLLEKIIEMMDSRAQQRGLQLFLRCCRACRWD
jgi:signal transduction histidine kinase